MQKDADTLKWATETARGKYYHVLYKINDEVIDGNNVWHFIPIAKVDPVSGYSTPGTTGPVTLSLQAATLAAGGAVSGGSATLGAAGTNRVVHGLVAKP